MFECVVTRALGRLTIIIVVGSAWVAVLGGGALWEGP